MTGQDYSFHAVLQKSTHCSTSRLEGLNDHPSSMGSKRLLLSLLLVLFHLGTEHWDPTDREQRRERDSEAVVEQG